MDFQRWFAAEERQFFERKSTWDRSGQHPKPRRTKDIAYDIAETLSAMANPDGGELNVWLAGQWLRKEGKKRWTVYYPGDRLIP